MSRLSGKTWGGADKIIENGESGLRKAASNTPGLNQLREGIPKHVHNTDCDSLNHRDDRLG